jgi:antitoxin CptB
MKDNTCSRLKWQCRRGMLEVELFLNCFLEQQYPSLSAPEKKCFSELLAFPDVVLDAWFSKKHRLDTKDSFYPLVKKIQQARCCLLTQP